MADSEAISNIARRLIPLVSAAEVLARETDILPALRQLSSYSDDPGDVRVPGPMIGNDTTSVHFEPLSFRRHPKRNPNPCGRCSYYRQRCETLSNSLCIKCRDLGLLSCVPKKPTSRNDPAALGMMREDVQRIEVVTQSPTSLQEMTEQVQTPVLSAYTGSQTPTFLSPSTETTTPSSGYRASFLMDGSSMQAGEISMTQRSALGVTFWPPSRAVNNHQPALPSPRAEAEGSVPVYQTPSFPAITVDVQNGPVQTQMARDAMHHWSQAHNGPYSYARQDFHFSEEPC
ncbi:hypothetical protein DFH11DRAFT_1258382 [Phellopilus nigrolimitatus]|nr:hypothetical protein DFH11DRAFT_1258382 [Phellopilus nigrolimitatus]